MSNVYISSNELADLLDALTITELKMYNYVKNGVLQNVGEEFFTSKNIANEMALSTRNVDNLKSSLKKKGYLIIDRFKDNRSEQMVRVVIGKDQVMLYNLGLNVEITNAKAYRTLLQMFPLDNPTLGNTERTELLQEANEYYLKHKQDFI